MLFGKSALWVYNPQGIFNKLKIIWNSSTKTRNPSLTTLCGVVKASGLGIWRYSSRGSGVAERSKELSVIASQSRTLGFESPTQPWDMTYPTLCDSCRYILLIVMAMQFLSAIWSSFFKSLFYFLFAIICSFFVDLPTPCWRDCRYKRRGCNTGNIVWFRLVNGFH